MDVPSRSRMVQPGIGPAGGATVRPEAVRRRDRATVWRAGRGAGTLAALCMLAAGTEAAAKRQAARDVRSRAAGRDLDGVTDRISGARPVKSGEIAAQDYSIESSDAPQERLSGRSMCECSGLRDDHLSSQSSIPRMLNGDQETG